MQTRGAVRCGCATCARPTATEPSSTTCRSTSSGARPSRCSGRTARASRRRSRSSRATGAGRAATSRCSASTRRRADSTWKARLGIVLQSTGQAGLATVREQLRQFAGFYPNPRDVDEVIAAVGLEAQAKTRISKLSGRAAAAGRCRARHHRPARAAVPRRADDRVRSARAPGVLGPHPRSAGRGHHDRAHHPLPRRGRAARRSRRGHRRGAAAGDRPGRRVRRRGGTDADREVAARRGCRARSAPPTRSGSPRRWPRGSAARPTSSRSCGRASRTSTWRSWPRPRHPPTAPRDAAAAKGAGR